MLSDKRQRFVDEYMIDLNATQAAIRAGYAPGSADVTGARLLGNASVAAAIAEKQEERSARTGIDADWVLTRLGEEATADVADIYDESGALKSVHDWPLIWRQGLVAGIEAVEERDSEGKVIGVVQKVKLSDRIKRIELIGKHVDVQAFKDRVDQSGTINVTITGPTADL